MGGCGILQNCFLFQTGAWHICFASNIFTRAIPRPSVGFGSNLGGCHVQHSPYIKGDEGRGITINISGAYLFAKSVFSPVEVGGAGKLRLGVDPLCRGEEAATGCAVVSKWPLLSDLKSGNVMKWSILLRARTRTSLHSKKNHGSS